MYGNSTIEKVYYGANLIKFGKFKGFNLKEVFPGVNQPPSPPPQIPTSVSWTEITMPSTVADQGYKTIAFGNNIFVATRSGNANSIAVSLDTGSSWNDYTTTTTTRWESIVYGDAFIIGSVLIPRITKSTNGTMWTEVDLTSTNIESVQSLAYNGERYVAVGANKFAYSTDSGLSWTGGTIDSTWGNNNFLTKMAYGDNIFVVINSNETSAGYSANGTTWSFVSLPTIVSSWEKIIYSNDKFIALPYDGTTGAYSVDGISWNALTLPSDQIWGTVGYGGGAYVLLEAYDSGLGVAGFSVDGINWTAANQLSGQYYVDVVFGNNKFIAVSEDSNDKGALGTIMF